MSRILRLRRLFVFILVFIASVAQAATYSGTVPVMFINTENNAAITSKENYLNATYYLDPMGCEGVEALGSVNQQLPLEIRGRGNYTWNGFNKKPYRIKFASKTAILGMNKSKHFALMANADDELSGLRNAVGYELARMLGMPWTPAAKPVEVVLNGDYIGLYFLTETVRVDSDRVNVVEQADGETDPLAITGGWLVEIDNYDSDPHVSITEGNGARIIFTYKTPEELSSQQEEFLRSQMESIDDAIYSKDKNSTKWEEYIDLDQLVRFYIVQEILDNAESFHGSCHMSREKGEYEKWKFGPVWDFGNSFRRGSGQFIYENSPFGQTWIGEIAKFPRFQARVKEVWKEFLENNFSDIYTYIDNYVSSNELAIQADDHRWPDYGSQNVTGDGSTMKNKIRERVSFLSEHWGSVVADPSETSYSVYFTTKGTSWKQVYVYSWEHTNGQTTKFLGDWPGTKTTDKVQIDGEEYYRMIFDLGYSPFEPMIIFNDGKSGVGEHQTEDLVLENNAMYNIFGKIGTHTSLTQVVEEQSFTVDQLTIYAQGTIALYNLQGVLVALGNDEVNAPSQGIYIVGHNNRYTTIVLR